MFVANLTEASLTMAEAPEPKIEKEIERIRDLLWGGTIKWDIFRRWSQGRFNMVLLNLVALFEVLNCVFPSKLFLFLFMRRGSGFEFSDVEPSALVQRQGGPCAVIAPVQAYLLKNLLLEATNCQNFANVSAI